MENKKFDVSEKDKLPQHSQEKEDTASESSFEYSEEDRKRIDDAEKNGLLEATDDKIQNTISEIVETKDTAQLDTSTAEEQQLLKKLSSLVNVDVTKTETHAAPEEDLALNEIAFYCKSFIKSRENGPAQKPSFEKELNVYLSLINDAGRQLLSGSVLKEEVIRLIENKTGYDHSTSENLISFAAENAQQPSISSKDIYDEIKELATTIREFEQITLKLPTNSSGKNSSKDKIVAMTEASRTALVTYVQKKLDLPRNIADIREELRNKFLTIFSAKNIISITKNFPISNFPKLLKLLVTKTDIILEKLQNVLKLKEDKSSKIYQLREKLKDFTIEKILKSDKTIANPIAKIFSKEIDPQKNTAKLAG